MPLLLLLALGAIVFVATSGSASAAQGPGGSPGPAPGPGGGGGGPGPAPGPLQGPIIIPGGGGIPNLGGLVGPQPSPTPAPSPGPPPPPTPPVPPLPAPPAARDGIVTTQTSPLRIRAGASLSAATLGTADKGSHLRIDGPAVAASSADAAQGTPSWFPVTQLSSGISGFAASEFITVQ